MTAIRPLSDELQKVAIEELNEGPERLQRDIAALREWIEKQPHLRARTDDQFLVSFLRGCKHSLEKAKSKIDHFYTIRAMLPHVFANNTMANAKNLMIARSGGLLVLPKTLEIGGPVIGFSRYKILFDLPITARDLHRFTIMCADMAIVATDEFVIGGYMEIVNVDKLGVGAMSKVDPVLAKQLTTYCEKGSAIRIKGIHVINVPKEGLAAINIIRNLFPVSLKERFFVHRNVKELCKHIPKEYLPIEYGGTNGCLVDLAKYYEKLLVDFNSYFEDNDNYGVDENLRTGKIVNMNSIFGLEGSFRKLEFD
ncbi:PREDICTED: alpha-tocopherol transfer protein-like [Rhagoletis zephyria]|uniref:alpha-tocopherol transfer protein-like n=1 Tax=Rhagoletis zephyria TaxID=28612 RepID=UPI0008118EE3|nr:PREDICTED: alpha-tocopherol transfer protein-like [Rhagoletis zephyria]